MLTNTNERFGIARVGAGAVLLLIAILMVRNLLPIISDVCFAVKFPYGQDYGEGIVWQQMLDMMAGKGYAPLRTFPAIVYHYPPVYHWTVAALIGATGVDPLFAGRSVSLTALMVSATCIGALVYAAVPADRDRACKVMASVFAALLFVEVPTVYRWAVFMRVDMLCCALTFAGIYLSILSIRRPRWIILAALVLVIAVFTKQMAIAGPLAVFLALLIARPRLAWTFASVSATLALTALIAIELRTDGEFLRHVILYNVNRFDPDGWRRLAGHTFVRAFSILLAGIAAVGVWSTLKPTALRTLRARAGSSPTDAALLILLIYLVLRTAMLALIMKSGSSDNYLIDWYGCIAIFAGLSALSIIDAVKNGAAWPKAGVIALFLIGMPLEASRQYGMENLPREPQVAAHLAALAARIKQSPRPVITDDMVLLLRGGQAVQFEPAIVAELGAAGLYDTRAFAGMIRNGDFGFFVHNQDPTTSAGYAKPIRDAIAAAYPRVEIQAGRIVNLPAAVSANPAAPPRRTAPRSQR